MAVQFDGTTATGLSTTPSFIPGVDSFPLTVCFFVQISVAQSTLPTSIFRYSCSPGDYNVETATDGVTLQFTPPAPAASITAEALKLGVWYFVAFAVDTSPNLHFYWKKVGARACKSVNAAISDAGQLVNIFVGNDGNGGSIDNYLNGLMAGVRIWRHTLNQAELERESTTIYPIKRAGILWAWSLDLGQTFDIINQAGTKATLAGNPANINAVANPPVLRIKPSLLL